MASLIFLEKGFSRKREDEGPRTFWKLEVDIARSLQLQLSCNLNRQTLLLRIISFRGCVSGIGVREVSGGQIFECGEMPAFPDLGHTPNELAVSDIS